MRRKTGNDSGDRRARLQARGVSAPSRVSLVGPSAEMHSRTGNGTKEARGDKEKTNKGESRTKPRRQRKDEKKRELTTGRQSSLGRMDSAGGRLCHPDVSSTKEEKSWWADTENEELTEAELQQNAALLGLPARKVWVPEAPRENEEAEDLLVEEGEKLGAAGDGRAPLPFEKSEERATE